MKNRFEAFDSGIEISTDLYLYNIQDNAEGLLLDLDMEGEDSPSLNINFGHHSLAFHSLKELTAIGFLDRCKIDQYGGGIYRSDDSHYIDWFLDHSLGLGTDYFGPLTHYLIKHADGLVNVISPIPPIFTLR